ncbi:hypothetical protein BH11PSE13_BH11PSE13_12170 [soil metagenome]
MSDAQAILGAGGVRLNVYDPVAQAYTGYGDILGADKFEITGDSDEKTKTSKGRYNYGQAIANVVIGKPTKIAITISAMSIAAIALQFQGIRSAWAQGAATVVDEAVVAKLDKWVKLANRNLSIAGLAVKHTTGAPTYVLHTDYEINYATGEIKALSGGAIAADQSLKVSYTAIALTGDLIKGGVRPQARMRAKFEGVNQVDSQYIECEVWEAVVKSSNGFDFLADDFNGIELTGTCVVPAGYDAPYEVRFQNAAA